LFVSGILSQQLLTSSTMLVDSWYTWVRCVSTYLWQWAKSWWKEYLKGARYLSSACCSLK
jgi:hypothetical protein